MSHSKAVASVAELGEAAGKKVLGSVAKKTGTSLGGKLGGQNGGTAGGLVGTAAGLAATKGLKELPKEGCKAAMGLGVGQGIDYTTKFLVTRATEQAARATAEQAGMAGLRLAAAQGARAAAGGGFASMAGELGGGFVGKKIGRKLAKSMKQDKDQGGKIGEELGAVSGAAGAGGAFGAMVAGPAGAAGGALLGVAGYGIGKVAGVFVEKATDFQGVCLVKPKLEMGKCPCSQDEAAYCIVTEESPGLGKCLIYFYPTREAADADFKKWWCSRIMFEMLEGRLVGEVERGGWPWNQANMFAAVKHLWAVLIHRPPGLIKWTSSGVEQARVSGVLAFLGHPKAGEELTDEQVEAFALASQTVEDFVSLEYLEWNRPEYTWTEHGVAEAKNAQVLDLLLNPAAGSRLTDHQLAKFAEAGTSLSSMTALGYVKEAQK